MHLIKEKYDIDEILKNKINNILKFHNIKNELVEGSIINIKNTNLAYIEPHKLKINNINIDNSI